MTQLEKAREEIRRNTILTKFDQKRVAILCNICNGTGANYYNYGREIEECDNCDGTGFTH